MLINEILNESISNVLYHFTLLDRLYNILSNQQLLLTAAIGTSTENDINRNRYYFMSLSRSKIGGYTLSKLSNGGSVINLNKEYLASKYKIVPISYWGKRINVNDNEMEDRLINNRNIIPFPNPPDILINSIHIFLDQNVKDREYYAYDYNLVKRNIILSKKLNIPVYIYNNKNSFLLQNINKSVSFNSYPQPTYKNKDSGYLSTIHRDTGLIPFRELYFKNKISELSKSADKLRYSLLYHNYNNDILSRLNSDIGAARSPNRRGYSDVIKTIDLLRKLKLSPSQFIDYLVNKWKNISTESNQA